MELYDQKCIPCRGGEPRLGSAEAADLAKHLSDWELKEDATWLMRRYEFRNYVQALEFVNAISDTAEAEGHHPDICFGWGYATVNLQTHKIKGLHLNDFVMAAKFDRVFAVREAG